MSKNKIVATVILLIFGAVFVIFIACKYHFSTSKTRIAVINRILKEGVISTCANINGENDSIFYLEEDDFDEHDLEDIWKIHVLNLNLTERNFKCIGPLKKLNILYFTNTNLYGDIFGHLRCTDLTLGFFQSKISDENCRSLRKFNSVSILMMNSVDISCDAYKSLHGISLRQLIIGNTNTTTNDLNSMLPLNELEHVFLDNTQIDDEIYFFFDNCPKLSAITIHNTQSNCDFLCKIVNKDKIESLWFMNTKIDDGILPSISSYRNLRKLELIDCDITEKSQSILEKLNEQVPFVVVVSHGDVIFSNDK